MNQFNLTPRGMNPRGVSGTAANDSTWTCWLGLQAEQEAQRSNLSAASLRYPAQ
jgi:hypothetical protein